MFQLTPNERMRMCCMSGRRGIKMRPRCAQQVCGYQQYNKPNVSTLLTLIREGVEPLTYEFLTFFSYIAHISLKSAVKRNCEI